MFPETVLDVEDPSFPSDHIFYTNKINNIVKTIHFLLCLES